MRNCIRDVQPRHTAPFPAPVKRCAAFGLAGAAEQCAFVPFAAQGRLEVGLEVVLVYFLRCGSGAQCGRPSPCPPRVRVRARTRVRTGARADTGVWAQTCKQMTSGFGWRIWLMMRSARASQAKTPIGRPLYRYSLSHKSLSLHERHRSAWACGRVGARGYQRLQCAAHRSQPASQPANQQRTHTRTHTRTQTRTRTRAHACKCPPAARAG